MAENIYKVTKKMKIMAGIGFPLGMITMILFLVAIYTKIEPFVYVTLVLFILAVSFEVFIGMYCLKAWYGNYKEKYKNY